MQKSIYKLFILTIIFVLALIFMSRNIKEEEITMEKTVVMDEASFPLLYLKTNGYTVNRLHGYSSSIAANTVREAITPINQSKELEIELIENQTTIRKIRYEIRKLEGNELLAYGTISGLTVTSEGKAVKIKLDVNLATSTEYAMKITAITDESRKINFYTRVKYYETDYFLKEKLDFVKQFHESTLDKENGENLARYLESNHSEDNTDFSKVTIYSNLDLVTWGDLKPEVITEVVPTIKELNVETASIQLEYFIQAETDSGTEVFSIKEFYRVRYTSERTYLLNYEREMEAAFDSNLISMSKSEFKLGVTRGEDIQLETSSENGKVAFVRNGELWYYNLPENRLVQVFTFRSKNMDYLRDDYDQHNIRILTMDDGGNINFMVYGYMNRGDYEGKVALVLYHFSSDTRRIEELVYIPLETTYQMLKEDIDDFSYTSERGIFYFTISNTVYSYNISAKRLEIIADGITEDNFAVLKESHGIAWLRKKDGEKENQLVIMNLETEEETIISAPSGQRIRILGVIQSNVFFGYVKIKDIKESTDGSIILPAYKVEIVDISGNLLKTYEQSSIFVVDASVQNNIMKLECVKKTSSGYIATSSDSILNQGNAEVPIIGIRTRATDLMLTEKYIFLPEGFVMEKRPDIYATANLILKEDTTLRLNREEIVNEKYYVYALGRIIASYQDPMTAILLADEKMGVVVNENNRLVWERSGKFNRKAIGQLKETYTGGGINSIGACLYMVLQYNQIAADAKSLSNDSRSIYNVLKENVNNTINLRGCKLDHVLYFVSGGNLIIGMKNASESVLITGYDEGSVTYFDPNEGNIKVSLSKASSMFEEAGNMFISYIN